MNSPRFALVAMLVAAEIVIIGLAFHVMSGGQSSSWHGMPAMTFRDQPYTSHTIDAIDAGSSPVVRISDPNSHVSVSVSHDGRVHVSDETSDNGMSWTNLKNLPRLEVTKTSDGVNIERADYDVVSIGFAMIDRKIDVQVPEGASLQIAQCAGSDITGIRNNVSVSTDEGDISLTDIRGNIVAHSSDGHIELQNAQGSSVDVNSGDGHIALTDVTTETLEVQSGDGSITASGLAIAGNAPKATIHSDDGSVEIAGRFASGTYEVSSSDGHVNVSLAPESNTTVTAFTEDGHVTMDGHTSGDDDNTQQTLRVGDGTGAMRVSSNDGSIQVMSNGAN